jgi:hypothetical protein
MHTQERKLPAISKGGKLPTQRSYSVGLVKAIGEESYAKWRYQQVASKAKLSSKLSSTLAASLRLQALRPRAPQLPDFIARAIPRATPRDFGERTFASR